MALTSDFLTKKVQIRSNHGMVDGKEKITTWNRMAWWDRSPKNGCFGNSCQSSHSTVMVPPRTLPRPNLPATVRALIMTAFREPWICG